LEQYPDTEKWLSWVDELSTKDYVIVDHFLNDHLLNEVSTFFKSRLSEFSLAGIGTSEQNVIRHDIRGDYTYWLDRQKDISIPLFWNLADEIMHIYNRYCFLSLSGYEFHLANYPPGSHYDKHLDQFNNRNNRMITIIIYLNKNWQKGDGGELEIYESDGSSFLVEPLEGRCVMFKSAVVPHRVLRSNKDRHSITGWLLHQAPGLGQLFG